MNRETIKNILNFLEEKEGQKIPYGWFDSIKEFKLIELIQELETHPDYRQYRHNSYLDLSYSNITKLPNDLYVDGDLALDGCKQLIKLPDDLYVDGDLALERCEQLTELPDNLYVGGNLWLYVSKIQEIPDNLYVGGDLHISETPLANKYTDELIRNIVASTGGQIIGKILR